MNAEPRIALNPRIRAIALLGPRAVTTADWDALVPDDEPFLSHAFLAGLEASGSLRAELGWQPQHLGIFAGERLVAALPTYLKYNSHGEFVFDHAWAEAHHRVGIEYYPKLLAAVPYSPVPGPRLLVAGNRSDVEALKRELLDALIEAARASEIASAHVNFIAAPDQALGERAGWIGRSDVQFHWHNRSYADFEQFLAVLNHKRRKEIRRERRQAVSAGWHFELRHGDELSASELARVHALYLHTFADKGNYPALTADFFVALAAALGRRMVAVLGFRGGKIGAMALCLRSRDTLYGRYWGSDEPTQGLHFEACYYQGIDYAIREGLSRFQPGAQGEHKIARGFMPVRTHSLHWIAHPGLRDAIASACARERLWLDQYEQSIAAHSPYRATDAHAD